jgi:hypothetical protein
MMIGELYTNIDGSLGIVDIARQGLKPLTL